MIDKIDILNWYVTNKYQNELMIHKIKNKHNAELQKTDPAAKVSCHKCSYPTH